MSNKTWEITQLQYFPEHQGFDRVVFVVNWVLSAERDGTVACIADMTNLTLDTTAPFTNYDDLTSEQVLSWVQDAIGADQVQKYYAMVDSKLDKMLQPILVTTDLPWAQKGYTPISLT